MKTIDSQKKKRWEMTEEERQKQDNKTARTFFLIILPLIWVGIFATGFIYELLLRFITTEGLILIGQFTIIAVTALVLFGGGAKLLKKFRIID